MSSMRFESARTWSRSTEAFVPCRASLSACTFYIVGMASTVATVNLKYEQTQFNHSFFMSGATAIDWRGGSAPPTQNLGR